MIEIKFVDEEYFLRSTIFFSEELARNYMKIFHSENWVKWIMINKEINSIIDSFGF